MIELYCPSGTFLDNLIFFYQIDLSGEYVSSTVRVG